MLPGLSAKLLFVWCTQYPLPLFRTCILPGPQLALNPSSPQPRLLSVSDDNIAFDSDVKYRFADYMPQFFNPLMNSLRGGFNLSVESGGATPKENQRFMNWMRIAALPRFRKLWGIIDADLKEGDVVQVTIVNRYNTYKWVTCVFF